MLTFRRFLPRALPSKCNPCCTSLAATSATTTVASAVQLQQPSSSVLCASIRACSSSGAASAQQNSSNAQQQRRRGNQPPRRNLPTHATVEFFDVRDSPSEGRELRVVFRHEELRGDSNNVGGAKRVVMSMSPQLGPRKTDPHDPTPQFDNTRRLGLRMSIHDIGSIVFWMSGRSTEPTVNGGRWSLKQLENGNVMVVLKGSKPDGSPQDEMSYELQPHQQVQFRAFMEEAMYGYWDLPAF